jgi:two-component system alkaline phosphatase synthesis response regulator PhoP
MNEAQSTPVVSMSKEYILIVDDEPDILELLRYNLMREGFHVGVAGSGEEALKIIRSQSPDLVLLDLMLPGMDGLEVCRLLRNDNATKHLPVVMITAKGEEADVVTGLELGADDYVTKPFSPRVLSARVKSVLRRKRTTPFDGESLLRIEGMQIDPRRHEVTIDKQPLVLTATEFRLLHFLARHRGIVFTRNQIVDAVHGEDYPVTDRSVDVQIVGLRRKLGDFASNVETVRGVGYRFKE